MGGWLKHSTALGVTTAYGHDSRPCVFYLLNGLFSSRNPLGFLVNIIEFFNFQWVSSFGSWYFYRLLISNIGFGLHMKE
jgi:hypothetical protein